MGFPKWYSRRGWPRTGHFLVSALFHTRRSKMKTFLIIAAIVIRGRPNVSARSTQRVTNWAFRRRAWLIVEWSDLYPRQVGMDFTPVTRCHLHLHCCVEVFGRPFPIEDPARF